MIKIHKAGYGFLTVVAAVLLTIDACAWLLFPVCAAAVITAISLILLAMFAAFFRNPLRVFSAPADGLLISPADGVIKVVEEVAEMKYFEEKRIQVSIFMSPLDVHINWFPIAGVVKVCKHFKGNYHRAFLPKSSTENEHTDVVIEREDGCEILVRQIAGAVARRIVTYTDVGDRAQINKHLGFIKLGSRIDIFLPLDAEVKVKINDKVKGNSTVLAVVPTCGI
jgi:phosphatidylserine decarboxylase